MAVMDQDRSQNTGGAPYLTRISGRYVIGVHSNSPRQLEYYYLNQQRWHKIVQGLQAVYQYRQQ